MAQYLIYSTLATLPDLSKMYQVMANTAYLKWLTASSSRPAWYDNLKDIDYVCQAIAMTHNPERMERLSLKLAEAATEIQ